MRKRNRFGLVWVTFWFVAACGVYEDLKDEIEGDDASSETAAVGSEPPPPPPPPTATPAPAQPGGSTSPPPASRDQVPRDFAGVEWLHTNVSGWSETATLDVWIADGYIHLNYDKARVWPARDGLNGNPWIFVYRDDRWYAATFEWFRFGQTSKPTRTVNGDHIKRRPLHDFRPRSGEVYGFMVSGLARDSTRNVHERTPVVMMRWP